MNSFKDNEKIVLIGGGEHCKVVVDSLSHIKNFSIKGIIDLSPKVGKYLSDIPIIGTDDDLVSIFEKGTRLCFITLSNINKPDIRIKIARTIKQIGFRCPNIFHPSAVFSKSLKTGEGNYIGPGVLINADVTLEDHAIINTGAIVEHDCKLGSFAHISSGVTLSGGVIVGQNSHIGAGTSIKQHIKIGSNSVIGTGSVVIENLPDNVVAYGNPCRIVRDIS